MNTLEYTPQELSDALGCFVAQFKSGTWRAFSEMPDHDDLIGVWVTEGICEPIQFPIEVVYSGDWKDSLHTPTLRCPKGHKVVAQKTVGASYDALCKSLTGHTHLHVGYFPTEQEALDAFRRMIGKE